MLHQQIYDETSYVRIVLRIGLFLVQLWSLEVHVRSFLKWRHKVTQSRSLSSVEQLFKFEDTVQSHLTMRLHDLCSLILILDHILIKTRDLIKKANHLRPIQLKSWIACDALQFKTHGMSLRSNLANASIVDHLGFKMCRGFITKYELHEHINKSRWCTLKKKRFLCLVCVWSFL